MAVPWVPPACLHISNPAHRAESAVFFGLILSSYCFNLPPPAAPRITDLLGQQTPASPRSQVCVLYGGCPFAAEVPPSPSFQNFGSFCQHLTQHVPGGRRCLFPRGCFLRPALAPLRQASQQPRLPCPGVEPARQRMGVASRRTPSPRRSPSPRGTRSTIADTPTEPCAPPPLLCTFLASGAPPSLMCHGSPPALALRRRTAAVRPPEVPPQARQGGEGNRRPARPGWANGVKDLISGGGELLGPAQFLWPCFPTAKRDQTFGHV